MTYPSSVWPEPWLAERAWRSPEREALICGELRLSYRALHQRAQSLALRLRAAGVRADEPVAVLLPSGVPLVVLLHALRYCGAVLLPLNLRLETTEWVYQLADAGARWLVYAANDARGDALGRSAAPGTGRLCIGPDETLELAAPAAALPPRDEAAAALLRGAYAVLYTSGTSGRPKGAVLGPENLLAAVDSAARHVGAGPGDRWLACLPLYHVAGLAMLLRSCLAGATLVLHARFCPLAVWRDLHERRISHLSLVAAMLQGLLDVGAGARAPAALRCVLLGGGPVPATLAERALALGYPLAPTYGLTEACSQVATQRPEMGETGPGRGLRPLPGIELRITAGRDHPTLPAGRIGEIAVRAASVMRGYLNRPEAGLDPAGWLYTGDLGRLDEGGRLSVIDRRDDLIVSGGENIYPGEIEAVLMQHPAVLEAAVVGVADERYGARPVAYWVARGAAGAQDLAAFCRARLGGYKVPVAFCRLDGLPRNALGKLQRRNLCREHDGLSAASLRAINFPDEDEERRRTVLNSGPLNAASR